MESQLKRVMKWPVRVCRSAAFLARLRLCELRGQLPVVVYSCGKTGTSTMTRSLRASGLSVPVCQVHRLTDEGLARSVDESRYMRMTMPLLVHAGRHLQRRLKQPANSRWQIVTLVRDPVATNISAFFETFPLYSGVHSPQAEDLPVLMRDFHASYDHNRLITWFDREMHRVFPVDVYEAGFPVDRGYEIYRLEHADILVMRLEDLRRVAKPAMRELMGLRSFRLIDANIASSKNYRPAYDRFRHALTLSSEYLDTIYQSQFARTFYSDAELVTMRNRWERRRAA